MVRSYFFLGREAEGGTHMVQYMEGARGERSLSELYQACARDDTDAIAEFVRLYQPELASYARRRNADDPEGAADLATFDTVRRLADMRSLEESAIRAYLYRCLKSRMIDEGRRTHLHQVSLDDLPTELATDGPESPVLDRLGLDEMLDLLTPAEREVVSHRFVAGYTSVETAERVGRSPDAVRRLQSNALARLRLALAVAVVLVALGAAVWVVANSPVTGDTEPIGDETEQPEPDANPESESMAPSATTPAATPNQLPVSTSTVASTPDRDSESGIEAGSVDRTDGSPESPDPEEDPALDGVLPAIATETVPPSPVNPPATNPDTSGRVVATSSPARPATITSAPTTTTTPLETTAPSTSTPSTVDQPDGQPTTPANPTTSVPPTTTAPTLATTTSTPVTTTSTPASTTTEPDTQPGPGRGPGPGGPPTDDGRAGPNGRPHNDDPDPNGPPGNGNGNGNGRGPGNRPARVS